MKENKIYYGTDKSDTITYLEFGEIDLVNSKKKIWNFQLHQRAYDWLMLGRYANDLQAAVNMQEVLKNGNLQKVIEFYNKEVHHNDEASLNLAKLIALAVTKDKPVLSFPSFFELGQTIFGCIEGMEFYSDMIKFLNLNFPSLHLKNVEWYGVDISEMFNQLSVTFHREYKVHTMTQQSSLPKKMDVFFSKGITLLYAIRNIKDLFNTIQKGRLAIFDYSFSLDKIEDTTIGSGKNVRYLKLDDFLSELKNHEEVLHIKKSNSRFIPESNRVWIDCILGEKTICERYIELDKRIRKELYDKLSHLPGAERFLNNDESPQWIPVSDFLKTIK